MEEYIQVYEERVILIENFVVMFIMSGRKGYVFANVGRVILIFEQT